VNLLYFFPKASFLIFYEYVHTAI